MWWYQEGWGFNDDSYRPEISHLWTTLYDDGLMRNIPLMQSDEYAPITVSLCSHDNHNIVLAVQETAAIQETANATYVGYELDRLHLKNRPQVPAHAVRMGWTGDPTDSRQTPPDTVQRDSPTAR